MLPLRLDAETLRRSAMFRSLSDADCKALIVCLRGRRCMAGQVLFREGDPGTFMVLLTRGTAVATARSGAATSRELGVMGAGEVVGEMAFLDPAPRSATVSVTSDAEVYELSQDAMEVLRQQAPSAARAIVVGAARSVAHRLRRLEERIDDEMTRAVGRARTLPAPPTSQDPRRGIPR